MGDTYEVLNRAKFKPNGLPYYVRRKTGFASLRTKFFRLFYFPQNEFISISSSILQLISFIFFFLLMLFIGRAIFADMKTSMQIVQTIDQKSRLDCHLELGLTKEKCLSRGCIYDESLHGLNTSIPMCYYIPKIGYKVDSTSGNVLLLKKDENGFKNPYGEDFTELIFTYKEIGAGMHISIYPSGPIRYRPPISINDNANIESVEKLMVVIKESNPFTFSIVRMSNGEKIWNTEIGGLFFSDQFLQIATLLPSENIYGFGEQIHTSIKHDLGLYKTWAMFSRDEKTDYAYGTQRNLYGVHPFYLCIENDGKTHGVLFFNSNAQEVTLGPAPHLVYRTIGGQFEFFYFPGPTPEEVIRQYQQVIGNPMLPPYWALGYQLSQWGYKNLDTMRKVVERTQKAGVPLDVITADIDYMYHNEDFSYDFEKWKGFPEYAHELRKQGLHLNLILDPGIEPTKKSWLRAKEIGASFIEWPNFDFVPKEIQNKYPMANDTKILLGVAWPDNHIAWPDFFDTSKNTQNWWTEQFIRFQKMIPYDGVWLDLNEPSSFSTNENDPWYIHHPEFFPIPHKLKQLFCPLEGKYAKLEVPPYPTVNVIWWDKDRPFEQPIKNFLSTKTLCMVGEVNKGQYSMYDTHSLYGLMESIASFEALQKATGKRGAVVSRSTFVSSGKYVGHWLGDNTAEWKDLKASIIGIMEFNMFGIPYVGADICGFNNPTFEELCLRWHQLGAFYSFSRNHNDGYHQPAQDPGQWPQVSSAARKSYEFRYRHLPYLYSLHFQIHIKGGTVLKPVFFEFVHDPTTYNISEQFMWGPAVMVVPVTDPDKREVEGYLPNGEQWYSLYDFEYGRRIPAGYHKFKAPTNSLPPIFARGGYIIPRQKPSTTTAGSRKNDFQLLISLTSDNKNNKMYAEGELFWDDGESIISDIRNYNYYHFELKFTVDKIKAELKISRKRQATNLRLPLLSNIEILGYTFLPLIQTTVLDDNQYQIDSPDTYYDGKKSIVNITTTGLIDLNKNGPTWTLKWQNSESDMGDTNLISLL